MDLWLECRSEREISKAIGVPQQTINGWLTEKRTDSRFGQAPDSLQHFDVWTFAQADGESGFVGKMPTQVVENVLWAFTEVGQVVFDPFVGSGTTIEVAKRMGRRVWASDLNPSTPLLPIHWHDITAGWPKEAPTKVDLIFLDPPYWQQTKGKYSDDPRDLANQSLEEFMSSWGAIVETCKQHLADGGRLAFIISATRTEDAVIDHAFEMWRACADLGFKTDRRIIVPYTTEVANGQQVEWARHKKKFLIRYRDLIVMTVAA